ncbi:MAG: tRNA 2-selenouridine synthase [Parachlamydiales bacterium]|nr:tRNA 2-selenouridine synthase [Parachlamydiales bacterium]
MEKISIDQIFIRRKTLIDVRSPVEYAHGHIPHAINLPLFNDAERALVGLTYKKEGKRCAIEKGLQLVSFDRIVQEIRRLDPGSVDIYCARGGMRSSSMAWLFELIGFEAFVIAEGYKSYRRWALNQFSLPYSLFVLGGETGSGKTKIIKALAHVGQNVIDLEALACHRGSVFGDLGSQPTQEQFENNLAAELYKKKDRPIWVEDESGRIGSVEIPPLIFEQIRKAPMVALQVPQEQRAQECLDEYLGLGSQKLSIAIRRLCKRMGRLETKKAIAALEQNQFRECCQILLRYYDKKYRYGMSLKDPKTVTILPSPAVADDQTIQAIKRWAAQISSE